MGPGMDRKDPDLDLERAEALLPRYATAGPRYTSYPTAPAWSEAFGVATFGDALVRAGRRSQEPLSLYVHVPFCRSLCHFCACNRVITRDAALPERYLEGLAREVATVRETLAAARPTAQLHLGGGTPTHLAPEALHRLTGRVLDAFPLAPGAELSIEVDPRVTGDAHVDALRELGYRRVSLGVQDFDPRVQAAIHRIQPAEVTARLVERARAVGFRSVGFDLIYGLPFQTEASFATTLDEALALRPDRVALYSYAHVTWVAKQQRGFERGDLPKPAAKLRLFAAALRRFLAAGYVHVGLDHFALPDDDLVVALRDGSLRRNFMGYTTRAGSELLAFGPSGISELRDGFAQSLRELDRWEEAVRAGRLATFRGHAIGDDDRDRGFVIARLLCRGRAGAAEFRAARGGDLAARFAPERERLAPLVEDGLVELEGDGGIRVTDLGRLFLRNVAMVFDAYLPAQQREPRPLFSQTV
jgi:oxygen-independent coproporphyrinogen-3 oxidase